MNEPDPLGDELRALPREHASTTFTSQVLARQARATARPVRVRRSLWAAAALSSLAAAGIWQLAAARHERRIEERAQRLLAERRQLEGELVRLRELARVEPALYVAGGEDFEVVVGLAPWLAARQGSRP